MIADVVRHSAQLACPQLTARFSSGSASEAADAMRDSGEGSRKHDEANLRARVGQDVF